ncbi:hypothetical protein GmRootA79_51590 [Acidovorax sp. A79]
MINPIPAKPQTHEPETPERPNPVPSESEPESRPVPASVPEKPCEVKPAYPEPEIPGQ